MTTRGIWLRSARVVSLASSAIRLNAVRVTSVNAVVRTSGFAYNHIHTTALARNDGEITQDGSAELEKKKESDQESQSTASSSKQTLDKKPKPKVIRRGNGTPLFVARSSRSMISPERGLANSNEGNTWSKGRRPAKQFPREPLDFLKESERIFKDDEVLRTLMLKLRKRAKEADAAAVINICTGIQHRMRFVERSLKQKDSLVPPAYVFHMLLRVLGTRGDLVRCKEVLEDMRACDKEVGVTELELLLRAAVYSGNADEAEIILSDLVMLLNGNQSELGTDGKDESSEAQIEDQILSTDYMRNWTANMYRIMILQCQLSRNLEYALALLGAAGQRSKKEQDSSSHQLFLHEVLDLSTIKAIINLARDCRQARLMSDLALWLDEGAAKRKLDYQIWMEVLRCCAEEHWFPGVELAWERAVERGLYKPDEGLFMSILHCASRASQPNFIEKVLKYMESFGQLRYGMREWHLMPLFDAQCNKNNFEGALRTATKIAKLAHVVSLKDNLMSLASPIFSSTKDVARNAYKAYIKVGRDESEEGGVITRSMNSMIRLANKNGLHEMALKIYGVRKYLANGLEESKVPLPKLPTFYLELGMNADQRGEAGREVIRQTITQLQDMDTVYENTINPNREIVRPDIATFNALLAAAINVESCEMGEFVFRELNAQKITADETTYERAIILFVTQPNYSDAYDFLKECQSKGMIPTRAAYLAIGLRCLEENDDRWISIGKDMVNNNYYPGHELRDALLKGGFISGDVLQTLERKPE